MNKLEPDDQKIQNVTADRFRLDWLIGVIVALAAFTGCTSFEENLDASAPQESRRQREQLVRIAAASIDPDGRSRRASQLKLSSATRKVSIPHGFTETGITLYVRFAEERYDVDSRQETVEIPQAGSLIAELTEPTDPRVIGFVDGVGITAVKNADVILEKLSALPLRVVLLSDLSLGRSGVLAINKLGTVNELVLFDVDSSCLKDLQASSLKALDVNCIRPETGLAQLLDSCTKLSRLTVQNLSLNERTIDTISRMNRLTHLTLNNTNLNDKWLTLLLTNLSLERLGLHRAGITDKGLSALPKQDKLKTLNLSGCSITDKGMKLVCLIPKLENLDIAKTDVTDKGVAMLRVTGSLRSLKLTNTCVTKACLEDCAKFPLRTLTLHGTNLEYSDLRNLKKQRPDLQID